MFNRLVALVVLVGTLAGCPPHTCPPGYTPHCQTGPIHGTRCYCEPPGRYAGS